MKKKTNNQNCRKIELYGSLTTKKLKKKHSSRLVGGKETGSQDGEQQGVGWRTRQSNICVRINQEEQLGSEIDYTRVPIKEKKASKTLTVKTCGMLGVVMAGETPSLTGEFIGETHRVLECIQIHPLGNQHEKGPICFLHYSVKEVTESQTKAE